MKNILMTISLIILSACATNSKNSREKKLEEIEKTDFKQPPVVKYTKNDDKLAAVKSEFTQVSNSESLERVIRYDGDFEEKGTLGDIVRLCYEKKFNEAFEIVKLQNKSYLKNPIFWNHVGTCYLLKGKRRKALLFLNKSLSMKENYAPALNNLGVMYMKEGDYARASVAFERALRGKEFSATPRFNLANLYLNFGLYDESLKHLKTLYSMSGSDVDVLNMLGTTFLMKQDYKQAVKYFAKIDDDFLEKGSFGINYALAVFENGDKEKGLDLFDDIDQKKMDSVWNNYYKEVAKRIGYRK